MRKYRYREPGSLRDLIPSIIIFVIGILVMFFLFGCSPYNTQNQWIINDNGEGIIELADNSMCEILDIREEPLYIHFGLPRQPEIFAHTIMNFRGYDSQFKWDNMIALAMAWPDMQWWPFMGAK